ncbi:MAG TPA: hypothetical protein VEK08_13210 [Planctomycetota bacterium]|nr:hypothetical protein [Planctomycetota bacterium]
MSEDYDAWTRPNFQPGGGDAFLLYVVFGEFEQPFALSRKKYRSDGAPEGVTLSHFTREKHPNVFNAFTGGPFAKYLEQAGLEEAVHDSPECVLVRGCVVDPPNLKYMQDTVGVLTCLLDQGGVALEDSQILRWWNPDEWRERLFEHGEPRPNEHTVILISDEETTDGTVWLHTRGMRKFGRPDLSIRSVNPAYQECCAELCNRFVHLQALGQIIPDGQKIKMRGLPDGMVCRHAGDLDDPEFNNVHVEILWPEMAKRDG